MICTGAVTRVGQERDRDGRVGFARVGQRPAREKATGAPSPTANSAAATVMTKKTNTGAL